MKICKQLQIYLKKMNIFFKWDYKSGYHYIDILPEHQKQLGFSMEIEGQVFFFAFTVLHVPFGLSTGPYKSSTWRELMVTYLVLAAKIKHLRGRDIKHRTDNQNTERILVIGNRNQQLHQLAIDIYKICKDNSRILIPEWIPREANWLSDQLSKDVDHDDYTLNASISVAFNILQGPHTVDRFASFH